MTSKAHSCPFPITIPRIDLAFLLRNVQLVDKHFPGKQEMHRSCICQNFTWSWGDLMIGVPYEHRVEMRWSPPALLIPASPTPAPYRKYKNLDPQGRKGKGKALLSVWRWKKLVVISRPGSSKSFVSKMKHPM